MLLLLHNRSLPIERSSCVRPFSKQRLSKWQKTQSKLPMKGKKPKRRHLQRSKFYRQKNSSSNTFFKEISNSQSWYKIGRRTSSSLSLPSFSKTRRRKRRNKYWRLVASLNNSDAPYSKTCKTSSVSRPSTSRRSSKTASSKNITSSKSRGSNRSCNRLRPPLQRNKVSVKRLKSNYRTTRSNLSDRWTSLTSRWKHRLKKILTCSRFSSVCSRDCCSWMNDSKKNSVACPIWLTFDLLFIYDFLSWEFWSKLLWQFYL